MASLISNAPSNNGSNNEARWKSDAFLNLYLPSSDGKGRKKLGAIGLKAGKAAEKKLIEWLKADPTRVQAILGKLQLEFQVAQGDDAPGFALD